MRQAMRVTPSSARGARSVLFPNGANTHCSEREESFFLATMFRMHIGVFFLFFEAGFLY
jgi:hypothetical protein